MANSRKRRKGTNKQRPLWHYAVGALVLVGFGALVILALLSGGGQTSQEADISIPLPGNPSLVSLSRTFGNAPVQPQVIFATGFTPEQQSIITNRVHHVASVLGSDTNMIFMTIGDLDAKAETIEEREEVMFDRPFLARGNDHVDNTAGHETIHVVADHPFEMINPFIVGNETMTWKQGLGVGYTTPTGERRGYAQWNEVSAVCLDYAINGRTPTSATAAFSEWRSVAFCSLILEASPWISFDDWAQWYLDTDIDSMCRMIFANKDGVPCNDEQLNLYVQLGAQIYSLEERTAEQLMSDVYSLRAQNPNGR
ncbi:hypothetical protein KC909_01680 [Candidatus Dojkabacteria bacterium]|uniref:Uncharacterized protein n=1 Tax=Candidatus Dojkabacteria bacterium TaxID=2099670 RepID=A0A955RIM6_9BACT|nr:hypothetical protein [Candidatus Dojkabacteria bacterium]